MGDSQQPASINASSGGGLTGTAPGLPTQTVFVAPATAEEKNLIVGSLFPVACWRVDDVRFDFDSSFVRPEVADEMVQFAQLREAHSLTVKSPDGVPTGSVPPPASIFGHADPTGNDDYNKQLSGRRSTAVYAMLTRQPGLWEKLYSHPNEKWGTGALRTMLTTVDPSLNSDEAKLTQEVSSRQKSAAARKALYLSYMDKVCGELKLDPKDDFLAGTDPAGKGDYQGCSEFNPLVLFSQQEQQEFSQPELKDKRDQQNAPNRRVVALLFRPGSRVDAARWPCPTVDQGVAGCKKRFWSDGEKRRSTLLPDQRRHFEETHDTFGCRFYQRLTDESPCEKVISLIPIQLLYEDMAPMADAEFNAVFDDDTQVPGKTDAQGRAVIVRPDTAGPTFKLFLNSFPEKYIYEEAQKEQTRLASSSGTSSSGASDNASRVFWPHGIMSSVLAGLLLLGAAAVARAAQACDMNQLPVPITLTGPLYRGLQISKAALTLALDPRHATGTVQLGDLAPLTLLEPKLELLEVYGPESHRNARYRLVYQVDECESTAQPAERVWSVCSHAEGSPRPAHRVQTEVLLIRNCMPDFDTLTGVGIFDTRTLSAVFSVAGNVRR